MVTLKEVAKAAGVSLSTASMALNGQAVIKLSTREKVEEVALELGYRKDGAAALLAGRAKEKAGGRKQIGLGYLRSRGQSSADAAFARFRVKAERLGYYAESIDLRSYSSRKRAADHLYFLNVRGLYIASPGALPSSEWLEFPWERFAAVKVGRSWPTLSLPLIRISAFAYMRTALMEVHRRGLQRFAVLLSESTSATDDDARLGAVLAFEARHREDGLTMDWLRVPLAAFANLQERRAEVGRIVEWLREVRPEVLVAFPGSWYFYLVEAGLKIPEELPFAAVLEDEGMARDYRVSGCLSRSDCYEEEAVRMLDRLLRMGRGGTTDGSFHVVIEPKWNEGVTLPM